MHELRKAKYKEFGVRNWENDSAQLKLSDIKWKKVFYQSYFISSSWKRLLGTNGKIRTKFFKTLLKNLVQVILSKGKQDMLNLKWKISVVIGNIWRTIENTCSIFLWERGRLLGKFLICNHIFLEEFRINRVWKSPMQIYNTKIRFSAFLIIVGDYYSVVDNPKRPTIFAIW